MPCYSQTFQTSGAMFYVINHPGLTWVEANHTHIKSTPGIVMIENTGQFPTFGRISYENYTNVGKIFLNYSPPKFFGTYHNQSQDLHYWSGFDVLTCK